MSIIQALTEGFTVLTPTRRLARTLQQRYAGMQLASGKQAWETPDVLPWSAWTARVWETFAAEQTAAPLLLNAEQQQYVWRDIVSESEHGEHFLSPGAMAAQAYDALKYMRQWRLPIFPDDALPLSRDALALRDWADAHAARCDENGWLNASLLEDALLGLPDAFIQQIKLCCHGFDELTPAQQALLDALQNAGAEVRRDLDGDAAPVVTSEPKRVRIPGDARDEITAIARWARARLQQADGGLVIGVVIPELERCGGDVETIFDDTLTPTRLFVDSEQTPRPYHLSLGPLLRDYPMIKAAFEILGLGGDDVALDQLGNLLRSPFIRDADGEMIARAQLDAHLRKYGGSEIRPETLRRWLQRDERWAARCPQWLAMLQQWRELRRAAPRRQSCRAWMETFSELLRAFGWPGDHATHSDEWQLREAWHKLSLRCASLELVSSGMSYGQALAQLKILAAAQRFQPENDAAPVQIMGLLEAAGMRFDHLWIAGLHAEVWPPAARPNPFLPLPLQRRHNMPHSSAERELEYARRLTRRLAASAYKEVIFSSPEHAAESDKLLLPSPLLRRYGELHPSEIAQCEKIDYAAQIFDSRAPEILHDPQGPAFTDKHAPGGSGMLKDQAACPFRAFARHRLGACALEQSDIGLEPSERGQLTHQCLQRFWDKIKTHEQLCALSPETLNEEINNSVSGAVSDILEWQIRTIPDQFIRLERKRLAEGMAEWLELEKQRQPFKVLATEQPHKCDLAGLEISTRIDRIDELSDGSLFVIDYKTGKVSLSHWEGERPREPQLPLYAVTWTSPEETPVAALAFAQIRCGENGFLVRSDATSAAASIPGMNKKETGDKETGTLAIMIEQWRETLTRLATEFRDGEARVEPLPQACEYCDLKILCRVDERRAHGGDDE